MTRLKLAKNLSRKFGIALVSLSFIASLVLAGLVFVSSPAASQSLIGIDSEVRNLRSRISRVEAEVRNLRSATSRIPRSNRNPRSRPAPVAPNRSNRNQVDDQVVASSDPMFKRLATLIIELKEEVRAIDKRLVILEQNQP